MKEIGDAIPADSTAWLVHDCCREYVELERTYRWWNSRRHEEALLSYNRSLLRLHKALANHNHNGAHNDKKA